MESNNSISAELKERVKPFLKAFTSRLLNEFEKEQIISKISKGGDLNYYKLGPGQNSDQVPTSTVQKDVLNDLFDFRNLARNILYNLKDSDSNGNNELKFTQVLSKLQERGAIEAPWIKSKNILHAFDKLDSLTDEETRLEISKMVEDHQINLNELTLRLLEFYGLYKSQNYFSDYDFRRADIKDSADLLLEHSKGEYPKLVFDFKFRKKTLLPSREIILKSLNEIEKLSRDGITPYFFLVIFTKQEIASFEKAKLNYIRMMEDIDTNLSFKENLKFIPVSLSYLNLIDSEFDSFKDEFIELNERFVFRSQTPPKNRPERNDHFLDRTFEFKKNTFEIDITPGSTKFWRLGFKFSKTEQFPLLNEDRHSSSCVDVHVMVGDLHNTNGVSWVHPEQIRLMMYNARALSNNSGERSKYAGERVIFTVNSNNEGSQTEFEVRFGNNLVSKQLVDLHEFNYCRIHAWCDYNQFSLDTEIKVKHKGAMHITRTL